MGTSIRPFLNTNLDLSGMTVRELQAAGGRAEVGAGVRIGNARERVGKARMRAHETELVNYAQAELSKATSLGAASGVAFLLHGLLDLVVDGDTVVLTTDHGSVLGKRSALVHGSRDTSTNLRYKFGEDLRASRWNRPTSSRSSG